VRVGDWFWENAGKSTSLTQRGGGRRIVTSEKTKQSDEKVWQTSNELSEQFKKKTKQPSRPPRDLIDGGSSSPSQLKKQKSKKRARTHINIRPAPLRETAAQLHKNE